VPTLPSFVLGPSRWSVPGRRQIDTAAELGIHPVALANWVKQDRMRSPNGVDLQVPALGTARHPARPVRSRYRDGSLFRRGRPCRPLVGC
jgi:hypothetical protein